MARPLPAPPGPACLPPTVPRCRPRRQEEREKRSSWPSWGSRFTVQRQSPEGSNWRGGSCVKFSSLRLSPSLPLLSLVLFPRPLPLPLSLPDSLPHSPSSSSPSPSPSSSSSSSPSPSPSLLSHLIPDISALTPPKELRRYKERSRSPGLLSPRDQTLLRSACKISSFLAPALPCRALPCRPHPHGPCPMPTSLPSAPTSRAQREQSV